MTSLLRALRYMRPYWLTATGAILSLFLVTGASLLTPQLLRLVVDNGIQAGMLNNILWGTAGLVGVALLSGLFNFTQGYWSEKSSQSVAFDFRNQLFAKLQTLSFSYHDNAQVGQLMTRVTSDVEMVRQFTGLGLFQLLNAVVMLVGSATILLTMNWQLALTTLAVIPLMLLVILRFIRAIMPIFGEIQAKLGNVNTVLQENLAGVRVVKSFAREPYEIKRFHTANTEYKVLNITVSTTLATNFPLIFLIANLGTALVIWVGGLQVMGGGLSIGELVAFNTYLALLIMPLFMLGIIASMLARASTSATRVFEVLDAPNDVTEKADARVLPKVAGRVAFTDVNFRYPGMETNVLEDVSFTVEPGQTVAITGPTGSGKSSIINLLPRFYDVTAGQVTVDDHDVRDVTLDSLRSQIGIVLQETVLFSGTIRENIAYGSPRASEAEIVAVAKAAQAHDFITALPQGYETAVGERGVGLSGGQKQRIAIARALLIQPRILILDDSTSAVDAETEYQIQQALDQLMVEPTSLVIAHRISTVQNADLILVLENGRIAAQGTHDTLLVENPLYAEIVQSQLQPAAQRPVADMASATEQIATESRTAE